jgi:hypothetical protein
MRIEEVSTVGDKGPDPRPVKSVAERLASGAEATKGNGTQPRSYNETLSDFNHEPSIPGETIKKHN